MPRKSRSNKVRQSTVITRLKPLIIFVVVLVAGLVITIAWRAAVSNQPITSQDGSGSNWLLFSSDTKNQTQDTPVAQPNTEFNISQPNAVQQKDYIEVNVPFSQPATGTCTFRFEQTPSVINTVSTTQNTAACGTRLALSRVPQGGMWSVRATFKSSDGQTVLTTPTASFMVAK